MTRITSSLSTSLPSKCEVSFDLKSTSSSLMTLEPLSLVTTSQDHWLGGWMENSWDAYLIGYSTTSTTEVARITKDSNYHNFKFVIDNGSVKFYIDDVEKGTVSISWLSDYSDFTFAYTTWSYSETATVKNLSIKAL